MFFRDSRGLPVFYGDVFRPEVLNAFNVGKAKAVICTLSDAKGTNKAVANLRREFPNLPVKKETKKKKKPEAETKCFFFCVKKSSRFKSFFQRNNIIHIFVFKQSHSSNLSESYNRTRLLFF